jgi:hypothetical protein
MMFISIHIPKTAGTALAKIFEDTSKRRVMFDYGSEWDIVSVRTCPPEVKEHSDFIRNYFWYLHGHFHYLKYADVFSGSPVITTVRDPVERVISQYLHVLRSGDRNIKQHKLVMDGDINVVDFAKFKYIGNAQWYYLEGRPIKDYDFIFVQDRLEYSLNKFCNRLNMPEIRDYLSWFDGVPKVNQKPMLDTNNRSVIITENDKQKIYRICERDVEVYRLANEHLNSSA